MLLTLEEFEHELRVASAGSMANSFRDFVSRLKEGDLPSTPVVRKLKDIEEAGLLRLNNVRTHPMLQEALLSANEISTYTDKWWAVVLGVMFDVGAPRAIERWWKNATA